MIKNYFKIAWRNILKGKLYTCINICGLGLAFCVTVFLFLTAYFQLSYDTFHEDSDRIFQTYFLTINEEGISKSGNMPLPLIPTLKETLPNIEKAARVQTGRKTTLSYNGEHYEELLTYTDPDFFQIFSFSMLKGNEKTALNDPSSIVLSASTAKAVFGKEDAIGEVVQIGKVGNQINYIVSGIIEDSPENSSIKYDAIAHIESDPNFKINSDNWYANNHTAFVKLSPNIEQSAFEEKLKEFSKTYFPDENQNIKSGQEKSHFVKLQALENVHFDREITGGKGAPIAVIYAIIGLAVFILLIACFNFINLNIARSFRRAKEVGIRKTLGGLKHQIVLQLWLETFLICLIGFAFGFILSIILLPQFNAHFGSKIDLTNMMEPEFLGILLALFGVVTILAGGFPAYKMANFRLVEVLKGKVFAKKRSFTRNAFIVAQFTISALLICISIISYKQLNYLRHMPTGFDKKLVYSIPVGNQVDGRKILSLFRSELNNDPNVISISGSGFNLGKGRDKVTVRNVVEFQEKGNKISTDWMLIDYDFLKTLNIPLINGRDFNRAYPADLENKVLITQSMATALGENNPIGKFFGDNDSGEGYQIIGVVADFNLYSSAMNYKPITMHLSDSEPINYIFLKINGQNIPQTLNRIKDLWKDLAPGNEFLGSFLNENVNAWYSNENALTSVFGMASAIAIFLSCLGLFAISLLVIELRTKEIGIRLVMGAGAKTIILMLSGYFLKLILIALIIALPLAFLAMQKWLENYPERIDLSIGIFIACGIAIMIIALLTVSFQAIKAALMNPVKSLRSE